MEKQELYGWVRKATVEGSENLNCSIMFELQTLMTNPFTILQYYLGWWAGNIGAVLPAMGHLLISEVIFGCHTGASITGT